MPLCNRMPEWKAESARFMRKNPTYAERILWKHLKGRQRLGRRFGRQRLMLGFIADFYCPSLKLVIEVDGPLHDAKKDAKRDKILLHEGIVTMRFSSELVFENLPLVLASIDAWIVSKERED